MGYSFRLAARVLLYAPSHREDNTYHSLCYTSHGALAGMRNSSMGPLHEGSIWWPITPWVNTLTAELHLAPLYKRMSTCSSSRLLPLLNHVTTWNTGGWCQPHLKGVEMFIWLELISRLQTLNLSVHPSLSPGPLAIARLSFPATMLEMEGGNHACTLWSLSSFIK